MKEKEKKEEGTGTCSDKTPMLLNNFEKANILIVKIQLCTNMHQNH